MFRIYCENKSEFYQWDKDQKLIVEDATIEEAHFCNGTSDLALCTTVYEYEGKRVVDVPNIILQTAKTFKVFGYTSGATLVEDKFRVNARCKPVDYVYTETEIKNWDELEQRLLEAISVVDNAVNDLSTVAKSGSYNDLTDKPNLSAVATSGSYNDLSDKPSLSPVAISGSYSDLTNKPITVLESYPYSDIDDMLYGAFIYVAKYNYEPSIMIVAGCYNEELKDIPNGSGEQAKIYTYRQHIIDSRGGFYVREKAICADYTDWNYDWKEVPLNDNLVTKDSETTEISDSSTHSKIPTALAVKNYVDNAIGDALEGSY